MDPQIENTLNIPPQNDHKEVSQNNDAIWVVFALQLLWPLGVILMWLWMKNWPKWGKILLTLYPLILVVFSLFIMIVLSSIYNPIQQLENAKTEYYQSVSVTPSLSPSNSAGQISTANWKTYTNKKYGFSFEYPSDWTILTTPLLSITSPNKPTPYNINVFIYDNPNQLSLKELEQQSLNDPNNLSGRGLGVYSNSAQEIKNTNGVIGYYATDIPCEPIECELYILPNKDKVFVLRNISTTPQNVKDIFKQVFSTFKFTDQVATPSGNPEGKFCGGIAGNLPENQCPSGYTCKMDSNYPDAGGTCAKQ